MAAFIGSPGVAVAVFIVSHKKSEKFFFLSREGNFSEPSKREASLVRASVCASALAWSVTDEGVRGLARSMRARLADGLVRLVKLVWRRAF